MKPPLTRPETEILRAGIEDLPAVAKLAGVVWRACYPTIISIAQIDYMLARMYALDTLREEIQAQGIHFERLLVAGELAGFASYGPTSQPGEVKLHKLYLTPTLHGRGYGSRLLQHCEREAFALGARRMILAVNKQNTKAIAAYRRNGFTTVATVVTDIGAGFVMDDFIMAKPLRSQPLRVPAPRQKAATNFKATRAAGKSAAVPRRANW